MSTHVHQRLYLLGVLVLDGLQNLNVVVDKLDDSLRLESAAVCQGHLRQIERWNITIEEKYCNIKSPNSVGRYSVIFAIHLYGINSRHKL